jgi:hypothetical protein
MSNAKHRYSQPKTHGAANIYQEVIEAIADNLEFLLNNLLEVKVNPCMCFLWVFRDTFASELSFNFHCDTRGFALFMYRKMTQSIQIHYVVIPKLDLLQQVILHLVLLFASVCL